MSLYNIKTINDIIDDLKDNDDQVDQFEDEYNYSRKLQQIDKIHNQVKQKKQEYSNEIRKSFTDINDTNDTNDTNNIINTDLIDTRDTRDNIILNRNTFFDMDDLNDIIDESDDNYEIDERNNYIYDSDSNNDNNYIYNSDSDNDSDSDSEYINEYIDSDNIIGGVFQSYDEKNYEKGILRQKDKLIDKEKNLYSYKYIDAKDNKEIKDEKTLERIRKLRIPPKWNYVWISKDPNSEIQVIGHDDRGKKQYLYTTEHKINATKKKFGNLSLLVSLIPKLDDVLEQDSKLGDYDKDKILSTITKIILLTGIRAGKEFHVTRNKSYGITSLRKKHIKFDDNKKIVILKFKGKSNVIHTHKIDKEYIYNHLKKIYQLKLSNDEDDKLFLYYDKQNKEVKKIDEFDLNNYLHAKIHPDIVIKDLRTYVVNYLLVSSLLKNTTLKITKQSKAKLKKFIKHEIEIVADYIQHTPSICKNSYIYPPIIEKFLNEPNYFLNKKNNTYEILKDLTK